MSGCREASLADPGIDLGFRKSGANNHYGASGLPRREMRKNRGIAILRLEIPMKAREFFASKERSKPRADWHDPCSTFGRRRKGGGAE
jgi:hypothetical protein